MQFFGKEILGSQLILSALIIFIIIKTATSFKKKHITKLFFVLWNFFWLTILYFIYYPGLLVGLAKRLGVGRGVDLAIYVSIICLFYLIYRVFIKIQKIDKQITKIVRELAIKTKSKKD